MILREYCSGVVGERKDRAFHRLRGPFIEADRKNLNNRKYPLKVVDAMISEARGRLAEGLSLFGQLGHPPGIESKLSETSHLVDELLLEGKIGHFSSKILETSKGQDLRKLLEGGARLGCSLRAVGEVERDKEGVEVVKEGARLISIDLVESPSFEYYPVTESTVLFESQRLDPSEEEILSKKFQLAKSAGYKGDWETFCLFEQNKHLLPVYEFARRCNYRGSFEDFCRSRRK